MAVGLLGLKTLNTNKRNSTNICVSYEQMRNKENVKKVEIYR